MILFLETLKLFYYKIPIIPQELYVKYKRFVLNEMMGKKESVFFVLKQK
jgi:hypothetical protein